ncbi:MAG: NADH-ubiquinone oxidoreductase chain H, partial [uncultured Gemmatimonadetes bacterium]
ASSADDREPSPAVGHGVPGVVDDQGDRGLQRGHGGGGHADADGAQGERLDAGPPGPQPRGPRRPGAAPGRRHQEHPEGRDEPGRGQPGVLHAGAHAVHHPGAGDLRGDPLRGAAAHALGGDPHDRGRPAGGYPVPAGVQLAGRVRHRAGRLGQQQQVRAAGRAAGGRADDQLRDRAGAVADVAVLRGGQRGPAGDRVQAAADEPVVRAAVLGVVLLLLDQLLRRDQPPAVRPPGGGERAGDRLPHRVQRDEVQHVLHRRVRARADGVGADGHAVPGRLGHPRLRRRRHARLRGRRPLDRRAAGHLEDGRELRLLRGQDLLLHPDLHAGALDGSALPVRPGDGPGVEDHASRRAGGGGGDRRHGAGAGQRGRAVRAGGAGGRPWRNHPVRRAGADGGERGDALHRDVADGPGPRALRHGLDGRKADSRAAPGAAAGGADAPAADDARFCRQI